MEKTVPPSPLKAVEDIINEFKNALILKGLAKETSIHGCSDSEVAEVEKYFGFPLPVVYRGFLRSMGHQAGDYQRGTDLFYGDILYLRESFAKVLRENAVRSELAPTCFVFCGHQGYIFYYFDINDGLFDPPVYGYQDGDPEVRRLYEKFSDYLFDGIR